MTLSIIFAICILIIFLYFVITSAPKNLAQLVGKELDIKPSLVEDMLVKMDSQRAQMLIRNTKETQKESIREGVFIFYAYQIFIKNQHPENIKWWHNRLVEKGYDPYLTSRIVATFSTYLKNTGIETEDLEKLAKEYNEVFCKLECPI